MLTSEKTADIVISIIICIFGLIGNIIVFFLIFILKEYKQSVTHWYIFQLAISDTIFLLTIPFTVANTIVGNWPFGTGMCKLVYGIRYINYYASIFFLMVMSIDRYLAVCSVFSQRLQKLRSNLSTIIISIIVWIVSILLSIPVIYFSILEAIQPNCHCVISFFSDEEEVAKCLKEYNGDMDFCNPEPNRLDEGRCRASLERSNTSSFLHGSESGSGSESESETIKYTPVLNDEEFNLNLTPTGRHPLWEAYIWFNFIVMFVFPIMVMSVCYGLILKKFLNVKKNINSLTQNSNSNNEQKRLAIVCLTLVATFFLCWIVYHITSLYELYHNLDPNVVKLATTLAFLNSALDPYLYSFVGPGCKRKLKMVRESRVLHSLPPMKSSTTKTTFNERFQEKSAN